MKPKSDRSVRNTKKKGARREHDTMALLESLGYRCTRSSASLGEWDVIGIGTTDIVLVQVKTNEWPGSWEMRILEEYRVPPNVRKLVHRWRDGQHLPDVREL